MQKKTLEQARLRYATVDSDIRMERLMTEIGCGGTKENSLVGNGPAAERTWVQLAAQIAKIKAKGGMVIYGWPCWED